MSRLDALPPEDSAPKARPVLYLTNLSSRKWHGPGRLICAMAKPPHHHRGDGRCLSCAPFADDLAAVREALAGPDDAGQHRAALAVYRGAFEAGCDDRVAVDRYLPGSLSWVVWASGGARAYQEIVNTGDTLFCACARPGSKARRTPCHLELLVPYLVRAGWDVMLDGCRVTMGKDGPEWAEDVIHQFQGRDDTFATLAARKGELYRAEAFGWPEAA